MEPIKSPALAGTSKPGMSKITRGYYSISDRLQNLLSRLDGVKQTGRDRWTAKCPAHEDRTPSLAIRELDDGRVLLHCFAGCSTADVLAAVGLEFSDLFPERLVSHAKPERRPFNPMDVLRCVAFEALVVATAAENIRQGVILADADHNCLLVAASRLRRAVEVCDA